MDNVRLSFADMPDAALSVRSFRVEEHISGLFEVAVLAVTPNESLSLSSLVGSRAAFSLAWSAERRWRGYCEEARFVRVSESGEGLATFEFRIRPELHRLGERTNNRLFQHATIPAIVSAILDDWKLPHTWQIASDHYPALELRMQYGESDFAFISRLLEEAGISYWFTDDGDETALLVLSDAPQANDERLTPVPFLDDTSAARASRLPFVTKLSLREAARPGRVTLREYDPTRARVPLFARADAQRSEELAHEQYHFAPGSFLSETDHVGNSTTPVADDLARARHDESFGATRARRMLEAIHSDRRVMSFDTSVNDLAPGAVFRVANHPRIDIGPAESFLVTSATFEGQVSRVDEWRFRGNAVSTDVSHRPKARTPKPRIFGIQTAVVVGPTGPGTSRQRTIGSIGEVAAAALDATSTVEGLPDNDIYVDEHGRVRVQFPWDRDHAYSSESSIWMRVSQGWAGNGYGVFTIPRVGHEVLVAFIDGDPDCPLIVGRAHNAAQPVPFPLPANKTVSTWKTASSPGGGGFNELRFDDAQGREHLFMQAQKDMDTLVKHDSKQAIGHDRQLYVQNDAATAVGHDRTSFVNQNEMEATGLNRMQFVGLNHMRSVGAEDSTQVGMRWSVTVARGMTSKLVKELDRMAGGLGGVMRASAGSTLGSIVGDPLAKLADAALTGFGRRAFDKLSKTLSVLDGFATDPGPPPTSIEMVDRQIKLSTGEASIVLDGPNIVLTAMGSITMHSMSDTALLSEREIAIAAREKVALISATDDVLIQAKGDTHLNPFEGSGEMPVATELGGDPVADAARCGVCASPLVLSAEGWSCPNDIPKDEV